MAVTKLLMYNKALHLLGERRLANEFEDRGPRYVLDEITNLQAYGTILELVKPRFAVKTVKLANPTTSTEHGLDSVYSFPADYISVMEIEGLHGVNGSFYADEDLENPIDRYIIEGRTVACDIPTNIYLRYVSLNASLSEWTPMFGNFVGVYLAREAASRLNPSRLEYIETRFTEALQIARDLEGIKESDILPAKAAASLSTDQLPIYNQVAHLLGASEFRHIDDESGLRIAIDSQYDLSRDYLLETIKPRFATEFSTLTDAGDSTVHAYDNVMALPADFLEIVGLWSDINLDMPVDRYLLDDNDISIYSYATAYLRYIQNDTVEADWSATFKQVLAAFIAFKLAPRYAPDREKSLSETFAANFATAGQVDTFRESKRPTAGTRTLDTDTRTLYNKALEILGLEPILANTDESERKVKLDRALDNKAIETVFELISWAFLYKSVEMEADDVITPAFGYTYAFEVPSDMTRLESISSESYFRHPLDYVREENYIFTDVDTLYLRYLSTDQESTIGSWPTYMFNLVAAEMARAAASLPGADKSNAQEKYDEYKSEAYNTDVQRNPPQVITSGSWTRARFSTNRHRYERP